MSFSNKQALIVGGSSGMGLETGRLLVESGASVTLIGHRQQKLDAARETFDTPDSTSTFRCDLRRKEDVDRLIHYIGDEMKDVKCLVNAAGVFSPKAFLEHTSEDYDAYMDFSKATFFSDNRRYNFSAGFTFCCTRSIWRSYCCCIGFGCRDGIIV